MNITFLKYLKCLCGTVDDFSLLKFKEEKNKEYHDIIEGILYCKKCKIWHPIKKGIPSIMPSKFRNDSELSFIKYNMENIPKEIQVEIIDKKLSPDRIDNETEIKLHEIEQRDKESSIYETFCDSYSDDIEMETIIKKADIKNKDIVLDLGAGTGRLTSWLTRQCKDVVAVDFSMHSLELLKNNLKEKNNVHLLQCDACYIPLKDETFSKVMSAQMLEHIPSFEGRQKVISNMLRVLEKQGRIVMTIYNYGIEKKANNIPKEGFHKTGIFYYCFIKKDVLDLISSIYTAKPNNVSIAGLVNYFPKKELFPIKLRALVDSMLTKTIFSFNLGSLLIVEINKN